METILKQLFKVVLQEKEGQELEKVIEEILSSTIYDVSDYTKMENVKQLKSADGISKHYNTLLLFSSPNYETYKQNIHKYITLTPEALHKLKMLSLIEYLKQMKTVEYSFLMTKLDIVTQIDLDELIEAALETGMVKAENDSDNKKVVMAVHSGLKYTMPSKVDGTDSLDAYMNNLNLIEKFLDSEINIIDKTLKK